MNIDEAIKTLTEFEKGNRASVEPDVHDAVKISIDVLRFIKDLKKKTNLNKWPPFYFGTSPINSP